MPLTYTPLVKVNEKVLFNYSDTDLENLYKFKFISKEAYDKEMNFRKKEREKTPKFRLFKDKLKVDAEHNQLLTTKRQPAKKKEPEVVESSSADEDAPAAKTTLPPKKRAPSKAKVYTPAGFKRVKNNYEKQIETLKEKIDGYKEVLKSSPNDVTKKLLDQTEKELHTLETNYENFKDY